MPSLPTSGVLRLDGYLGVELARAALGIRHLLGTRRRSTFSSAGRVGASSARRPGALVDEGEEAYVGRTWKRLPGLPCSEPLRGESRSWCL
jgi:hypothetical protein